MNPVFRTAALAAGALVLAPAAAASTGQLDFFTASKLVVAPGETVDFSAGFSIAVDSQSNGGSNPVEPAPEEGYQVWEVNWYQQWSETVSQVQLHAAGASYAGSPGSSGNWSFSTSFDTPGLYVLQLGGGWTTRSETYISTETASRNCYSSDPENGGSLLCDSWQWSYYDSTDSYEYDSAFSPLSLTLEVTAVPEPQTYALWLAGIAALAGWARRRRG